MWRCVETRLAWEAGSFPVSSEEGFDEGAGAALSLGTGDVNDVESVDVSCLCSLSELPQEF